MKAKKKRLFKKDLDKKVIFSVLLVVVIGIFILFNVFNRGTYSTSDDTIDTLTIRCPDTVNALEEVECLIEANLVTIDAQGLSVKYNVTNGMEFVEFVSDNGEVYSSDESGFVLVNLNGLTGNITIGKIKYIISEVANESDIYKIGFSEVVFGDGNDKVVSLNAISNEMRVLSNFNTLENIVLNTGKLNETFDKNVYNYTATVDSDKVMIDIVKTNEKSEVTGDIGEITLNYGTNDLEIRVISESLEERIYTISIYRPYTLSSDVYSYNKEKNYIYTGIDILDEIILDKLDIEVGLDKEIEDNKLIVKNDKEVLISVDVINISSNIYDLSKDYIYVGTNTIDISKINKVNAEVELLEDKVLVKYDNDILDEFKIIGVSFGNYLVNDNVIDLSSDNSYNSFVNVFKGSNGISYRVIKDNNLITGGNIDNGSILEIYYGNQLLEKYNITVYELSFDEGINVDNVNKYIKYLKVNTTVGQLVDKINLSLGRVVVYKDNTYQEAKKNDDIIQTGNVLVVYVGDTIKEKYILSVTGDANGDGMVDLIDLVQLRKHIVGWINPQTNEIQKKSGVYYDAIDMNADGMVDLIDLVRMRKVIVGLI